LQERVVGEPYDYVSQGIADAKYAFHHGEVFIRANLRKIRKFAADMTEKAKKIILYTVSLALAAVLLYFAFRGIDWKDFWITLGKCNWWWIIGGMIAAWLAIWLRGMRWQLLFVPLNKDVKTVECYDSYSIGYMVNMALPRAGEIAKCGIMALTKKVTFEASLGTMVVERACDVIVILVSFIIMAFFTRFGGFLVDRIWKPALAGHATGLWIVLGILVFCIALYIVCRINRKWLLEHSKFYQKVHKFWMGLVDGLKTVGTMKHKRAFILDTLLIWVCYWFMSWAIIKAMPGMESLNIMDALFLSLVGTIGWAVPVQGGFGAYHFIVSQTLLPIYGIPLETGLIFATLNHESEIIVMLIAGIFSLVNVYLITPAMRKREPATL